MTEAEVDLAAPPCVNLVSAFLAMEPLDCLISLARVCGGGSITESEQRFIWDNCISKADGNFHAPYMKRFLKKLIVEIESTGADVLDELYERYAIYMTSLKDDESAKGSSTVLKWVSFLFPDATCLRSRKMVIPLQCSLNMLEGDTGCSIWPSSLFLSEFILSCPEIFSVVRSGPQVFSCQSSFFLALRYSQFSEFTKKKRFHPFFVDVFSFASFLFALWGTSLVSCMVILSDGDLSSLANMKLNLGMNELIVGSDLLEVNTQEKKLVRCKYLPWESAPETELQDIMLDIVLGADVIYDPSCIPHLIRVLAIFLDRGKSHSHDQNDSSYCSVQNGKINGDLENSDSNNNDSIEFEGTSLCTTNNRSPKHWCQATKERPRAYVASVIRNIETFNYFLTLAEKANLTVTDITGEIKCLDLLLYRQSYQQSNVRLFMLCSD